MCCSLGDNTYICMLMNNVQLRGERMMCGKKWANTERMSLSRPKEMSCSGEEEGLVLDRGMKTSPTITKREAEHRIEIQHSRHSITVCRFDGGSTQNFSQ